MAPETLEITHSLQEKFEELRPFGDERDFGLFPPCHKDDLMKCVIYRISPYKPHRDEEYMEKLGSEEMVLKEMLKLVDDPDNAILLCKGCVESAIKAFYQGQKTKEG